MKVEAYKLGPLEVNCYVAQTEKSVVVFDTGDYSKEIADILKADDGREKLIILTHCHFDHISGVERLIKETGCKVAVSAADSDGLWDSSLNLCDIAGLEPIQLSADVLLYDNESLKVGDLEFICMLTPGHTDGSMCFLCENYLFSGDTLFKGSVGRTDFKTGSVSKLFDSLRKLSQLSDDLTVLSGHGDETTLGYEKLNNYYMLRANGRC